MATPDDERMDRTATVIFAMLKDRKLQPLFRPSRAANDTTTRLSSIARQAISREPRLREAIAKAGGAVEMNYFVGLTRDKPFAFLRPGSAGLADSDDPATSLLAHLWEAADTHLGPDPLPADPWVKSLYGLMNDHSESFEALSGVLVAKTFNRVYNAAAPVQRPAEPLRPAVTPPPLDRRALGRSAAPSNVDLLLQGASLQPALDPNANSEDKRAATQWLTDTLRRHGSELVEQLEEGGLNSASSTSVVRFLTLVSQQNNSVARAINAHPKLSALVKADAREMAEMRELTPQHNFAVFFNDKLNAFLSRMPDFPPNSIHQDPTTIQWDATQDEQIKKMVTMVIAHGSEIRDLVNEAHRRGTDPLFRDVEEKLDLAGSMDPRIADAVVYAEITATAVPPLRKNGPDLTMT